MANRLLMLFAAILASAVAVSAQSPPESKSPVSLIAIKAGKLIDVDAGSILSKQIILIRGDKISAVGAGLTIPPDARIIDLSDMTVLPGLIDCHTHLADGSEDGNGDPLTYLKKSAAQIAFESVPNARAMLYSGFTTVRDVGAYRG
ncbi:MAG TPA: amidohydrolase family protein, partial [Candidatus Acidoferrales bacterium]|nr:amidohydrolase family protein [Candidatus Acidoferrales bacterium]